MARGRKAVSRGRKGRDGRSSTRAANAVELLSSEMSSLGDSLPETPVKRTPKKAAPRGKWSEAQLLTSDKSVLIDADLTKLLANPAAWNCLEEDEKREILALLPADIHPHAVAPPDDPNEKIPPLPDSFLRYSNNWRDGIRQFQLDLQNGHYSPEWLRQADEARRQRENGDFDAFKEREFEQFWGQKQKMDMRLKAGECGRIQLGVLVDAGVILVGDVWRFTYVYGKGADRIVIDKEARVHEIDNSRLTFVIPGGQRVFLPSVPQGAQGPQGPTPTEETAEKGQENNKDGEIKEEEIDPASQELNTASENADNTTNHAVQVVIVSEKATSNFAHERLKRTAPQPTPESPAKRKRGRPRKVKPLEPEAETAQEAIESENAIDDTVVSGPEDAPMDTINPQPNFESPSAKDNIPDATQSSHDAGEEQAESSEIISEPVENPISPFQTTAIGLDEVIVPNVSSPRSLVIKILETDGRMTGARTANAWKEIRCYRKNQDMGSLWDVRQAWYFKQK